MAAESEIDNSTHAIHIDCRSPIDQATQELEDDGWCVIPGVPSPEKTAPVLQCPCAAAGESERREKDQPTRLAWTRTRPLGAGR